MGEVLWGSLKNVVFGCFVRILDSLVVEVSNNCARIGVDKILPHFRSNL